MPECVVCGMESDKLYKCKRCGERFCEECGDIEEKLCLFCLDEEEEYWEDEDLEEEEEEPW